MSDAHAGVGGSSGMGGIGGHGASGRAGAPVTNEPPAEAALEVRHAYVGTTVPEGCVTSAAGTPHGLTVVGSRRQSSGWFEGAGDLGLDATWRSTELGVNAALVFETPVGYAVAKSAFESPLELQFVDAATGQSSHQSVEVAGDPVAGVGLLGGAALLLSTGDGSVSLWRMHGSDTDTIALETQTCNAGSGFALGASGDDGDLVFAYACEDTSGASGTKQRIVVGSFAAGASDIERADIDVDANASVGATWLGDEFLFAFDDSTLAYVTPGNATPRIVPLTGLAGANSQNGRRPSYSVAAQGDSIWLTRTSCYGHEDAASTGSVAVCRVAAGSTDASCSEFDSPCSSAVLAPTSRGLLLLPCGGFTAPALIALDPGVSPAPMDAMFPFGYAGFAPLGLVCGDTNCSVLLQADASQPTTGYDERFALADVELGPECDDTLCQSGPIALSGLHSISPYDLEPGGFLVENAPQALPLGVVSTTHDSPDGFLAQAFVSLVDRDGVAWAEPLPGSPIALFALDEGFRVLNSGFYETVVTPSGSVDGPNLRMRASYRVPAFTRCADRVFFHAIYDPVMSIGAPTPAIFALDLRTSDFSVLFNPGVAPADYPDDPIPLGCTENHLFMLDGERVHSWSLDGTRQADIDLYPLAPVQASTDPVIGQIESYGNFALVARASSGSIEALVLRDDGSTRSLTLPVPEAAVPLVSLWFAKDRGDGWIRAAYQGKSGGIYVSAWNVGAL